VITFDNIFGRRAAGKEWQGFCRSISRQTDLLCAPLA
jgi:hypothetical protein